MSSTIQWWEGPSPSVNRPSHTAWFDSACCAMATGWRVWIGRTAVPSSTRSVARPMSAIAVSASKSPGSWGTQIEREAGLLGGLGIGDEPRHLLAVPPLLGADHQPDPHAPPPERNGN